MQFINENPDLFRYLILPLLIFLARVCDQTIGTLRLIYAAKGFKYLAMLVGFFESLIWLTAIGQIMKQLDNVYCYIAFAGGFATGNFMGIFLEQKISVGQVLVRVVFKKNLTQLVSNMKEAGYAFTIQEGEGRDGSVKLMFATIARKKLRELILLVEQTNPNAFYTVEDVRQVNGNYFNQTKRSSVFSRLNPFNTKRA